MRSWQLLFVSIVILFALHDTGTVAEVFDVTTIYHLRDDKDSGTGEIHARTNALGLPFTVEGELIEPITSVIPKCDSLKNGVRACNWTLNGWRWTQNNSPLLHPEGGVLYSFSPLTQKTDAHFIDLETVLILNLKGNSERSITLWLLAEQNLVREQDNFYFIEILWADDWWFKRKMRFGKNCSATASYEDKYDKSFIDIDLKITNVICEDTVDIETDWSNSRYFNEYIVIEVTNDDLSVWGDSAMTKKLISYTKSGMLLKYALILPRIYDISASYTKAKSLKLSDESGTITSPWLSLYTEKVCVVLVYKSEKLSMRSIPELWLEARDSNGQAAILGSFNTKDDGWRSERILATIPQTIMQENITLVINGVNNFAHVEIERIAGCNAEEEEDVALFSVKNGTMKPYTVSLAAKSEILLIAGLFISHELQTSGEPFTHNRTDCANGGVGFGNKCICPPGFAGKDCRRGCGPNRFGEDCGGMCSTNTDECRGLLLCYSLVGCFCAPGYHGDYCDEPCNYGQYGPNCSQTCKSCTSACDVYTGECSTCTPGFIPPLCIKTYAYTKFPPNVTVMESGKASVIPDFRELAGEGHPSSYAIQYRIKGEEDWKLVSRYDIDQNDDTQTIMPVTETLMEGLKIGKLYEARIVLYNDKGNSYEGDRIPISEFSAFCNPSQNASYAFGTLTGDSWFAVTWSYNAGENSCPVLYYQVLWKKGWKWFNENTTDTMLNITERITSGDYKFKVRAFTTQGFANFETFIPTMQRVADRVKNLRVLNITSTSITLSWHLPSKNKNNRPEYSVKAECLKRLLCENGCVNVSASEFVTENNSFTFTDLLPLTQYSVSVSVIRNSEHGPRSTVAISTNESLPMEVPKRSDLPLKRSNNSMTVYWSSVPVCTSQFLSYAYRVTRQKNETWTLFSGETNNTHVTIDGVSPNEPYKVYVYIKTVLGSDLNNSLEIQVDKQYPVKPLTDRLRYQDNKNLMSEDEVLLNLPVPDEGYWESSVNKQLVPQPLSGNNQSASNFVMKQSDKPVTGERINLFGEKFKTSDEPTETPVLNSVPVTYNNDQDPFNTEPVEAVSTRNQSASRNLETPTVLLSEKALIMKPVSLNASLHEVKKLTVYKQSRNLLGIRWAVPNDTQDNSTKYEITYTVDSVKWKNETSPDKCVPWPQFYCHTISPLQANKNYTVEFQQCTFGCVQMHTIPRLEAARFVDRQPRGIVTHAVPTLLCKCGEVSSKDVKTMQIGQPVSVTGRTAEYAPGPVRNLTVIRNLTTSVIIQWDHPYFSNGIIRSFSVDTEQTSDFRDDDNRKSYPAKVIDATVEKLHYVTQITELAPAATYLISVTAKTVQPGTAKSVEAITSPPPLEIVEKPLIVVPSTDDLKWMPQEPTATENAEQLRRLIRGNMLIVLANETITEKCNKPLRIGQVNSMIRSALGNNFFIVAENFKRNTLVLGTRERYSGMWGFVCNDALIPNNVYKLAIVQVKEYKGSYSVDYKFSAPFTATKNNNF